MRSNFFFLLFLTTTLPILSGFPVGTQIKIPSGCGVIQDLAVEQLVCTQAGAQATVVSKRSKYDYPFCLMLDGDFVITSGDQYWFLAKEQEWRKTQDLKKGDVLFNDHNEYIVIGDILRCNEAVELFDISLSKPHTFYVTSKNILAHNFGQVVLGVIEGAPVAASLARAIVLGIASFFAKNVKEGNVGRYPGSYTPTPPTDPEKDDTKVKIFEKNAEHIFRDDPEHFLSDTPKNRRALIETASDKNNFLGVDRYGNHWYGCILPDGRQIWACVRDNLIRNGGVNKIHRVFNEKTGLCRSAK